jgi:tonB-system energizer ExbB
VPSSSLFLLGQASTAFSGGAIGALSHIGWTAKAVLVVLCIFSFVSWAIIIYKGVALRRAYTQSQIFLQVFRKSSKFSEVNSVCLQLKASPLVGVFQAGYLEVNQQVRGGSQGSTAPAARPTVKSLDSLSRALARAATVEATRLERRVSFLATTASVTPFIGLFGTVWGIMNSFIGISKSQTTNLAVVAPGIAEALLATALGLAAAIPAVVIYNVFSRAIAGYRALLGDAAAEVLRLVSRDLERPAAATTPARRAAPMSTAAE